MMLQVKLEDSDKSHLWHRCSMQIAVVSGVNKLSLEICKNLAKKNVKPIVLASNQIIGRDVERSMKILGHDVEYRSVNDFSNFMWGMNNDYDKVDILINTADTIFKHEGKEESHKVLTANFFNNLYLTRSLLPLMNKSEHPRIVNILGTINPPCCNIITTTSTSTSSPSIMEAFVSEAKTLHQLEFLVKDYLHDVDLGDFQAKGWPSCSYAMSRLALISMTRILAQDIKPVLINACNSDYLLDEDISERGNMTVEEGAVNPVILATELPDHGPSGRLFSDDLPITW